MTFPVALVGTGYAGWMALKRSQPQQAAAHAASATIRRDEDYFRARIGSIKTADDLVADRRLLKVALTAFGLEGDIDNKAFIRKVLAEGTLTPEALANKLSDKRYLALSAAFGFGDFATPRTQISDFADKILVPYRTRSFEASVGEGNNDYRLAMNAERELADLAAKGGSEDSKWFTIMGSAPLRQVVQTALGLPASAGSLDLDRQLALYKDRAAATFGEATVTQFADPEKIGKLVRTYLLRSEVATLGLSTAGSNAVLMMMNQSVAFARAQG